MIVLFAAAVVIDLALLFWSWTPEGVDHYGRSVLHGMQCIFMFTIALYSLFIGRKLRNRIRQSTQHVRDTHSQLHIAVQRLRRSICLLGACLLIRAGVVLTDIILPGMQQSAKPSLIVWIW
jgi:hypothetical protein